MAKTLLAAAELVLGQCSQRGVGVTERLQLSQEVREAGVVGVRLPNRLERFPMESRRRERVANIRDRRIGVDGPGRLGEPVDELDPVHPARKALSDEDGGTRTEHAANLVCGGRQVRDVVNDEGEPRRIRRLVRQR